MQIIPNKPSILYAPNGFGKSSLAIAFDSISGPRLELKKDYFYRGDEKNLPELHIDYQRPDGSTVHLTANSGSNSIRSEIDTYVINSKIRAKSIAQQFGGRTNHSASIVIDTVELIGKIPPEVNLPYSINVLRARFGVNGKVLPNLEHALQVGAFLSVFYDTI